MGKQKRKRRHYTPGTPGSKYVGIGTWQKWDFCLWHQASPENHPLASLQSLHLFFSWMGLPWPSFPQPSEGSESLKFSLLNHFLFKISMVASVNSYWIIGLFHASQIGVHVPAPEDTGDLQKHRNLVLVLEPSFNSVYFWNLFKIIIGILWRKGHFKIKF